MYAVTAADEKFLPIIDLWEERVIACGLTPLIYDLGGLGRGEKFFPLVKGFNLFRQHGCYNLDLKSKGVHKPFVLEQVTKDIKGPFLYLDADCILRGDPTQFYGTWDIALTVRPPKEWEKFYYGREAFQSRIETGVFWFNDCQDGGCLADFIFLWKQLAAELEDDVQALNTLLENLSRTHGLRTLGVEAMPFPTELYNHYYSNDMEKAVVCHLKGGRWRDKSREELLDFCKVIPVETENDVYFSFLDDTRLNVPEFVKEIDDPNIPLVEPLPATEPPVIGGTLLPLGELTADINYGKLGTVSINDLIRRSRRSIYPPDIHDPDINGEVTIEPPSFYEERCKEKTGLPVTPYYGHPEAVIVSCFFNPQNNPYRLLAFQKFYRSIRNLNYRIYECIIGKDAKSQLPNDPNIIRVRADELLWHKESLLNMAVSDLPECFKYVFIVDADILFTNPAWVLEGVRQLQRANVIQPFEFCIHLEKNELRPNFDVEAARKNVWDIELRNKKMWKSFCSTHYYSPELARVNNYDLHGHVGFAWGFRRIVLEQCPLFEKALIGGADHILAHAVGGDILHYCISSAFADNYQEVYDWSRKMCSATERKTSYVPGDVYHIWHGDVKDRQYLKRVKEFTADCRDMVKDNRGFYRLPRSKAGYMNRYFRQREVAQIDQQGFAGFDYGFFEDMGYLITDILELFGEPQFNEEEADQIPEEIPVLELAPDDYGTFS